jgi:hypothetical protein
VGNETALLKLQHEFQDLEWENHFTVMETRGNIFYFDAEGNKIFLESGAHLDDRRLKIVREENGLPIAIEVYDLFGELTEEESRPAGQAKKDEEKKTLMLFRPAFDPRKYFLEAIDESGKSISVFPKIIGEGLDSALEILRDCEGVSAAEFSENRFLIEIDERVSQKKMLQDIENWLGDCYETKMAILTPEEYFGKFSRYPLELQCPPNQLKLDLF